MRFHHPAWAQGMWMGASALEADMCARAYREDSGSDTGIDSSDAGSGAPPAKRQRDSVRPPPPTRTVSSEERAGAHSMPCPPVL